LPGLPTNRELLKTALRLLLDQIVRVEPAPDGSRTVTFSKRDYELAVMAAAAVDWRHGGRDKFVRALERLRP
jgi:hypothetical protein